MRLVEFDASDTIDRIDEPPEARYQCADLGNLDEPLAEKDAPISLSLLAATTSCLYSGRRHTGNLPDKYTLCKLAVWASASGVPAWQERLFAWPNQARRPKVSDQ
jgi:hypothetical protein